MQHARMRRALGVVRKLRHAKKRLFRPPFPCHKFSKEKKSFVFCSLTPPPPLMRDVICERLLIYFQIQKTEIKKLEMPLK